MLPEMRTSAVRWITDCLMIYCVICASSFGVVQAQENTRALLLYSSDFQPTTSPFSNLISIQLDSITLNKIIAEAEAQAKVVKELNFRDFNGFTKLIEGESSKFSFFNKYDESTCDVSCDARCKQPPRQIISSPRPFLAKKDSVTGPPYLPPVTKKDEVVTFRPITTTQAIVTTTARQTTVKTTAARVTTTERIVPTTQPIRYVPTTSSPTQRQATTRSTTERPTQSTSQKLTIQSSTPRLIAQTTTQKPIFISTTSRTPTTTTQRTTRSIVSVTRPRSSTPGPTYLPVSKKSTVRRSTVTERSYPPATWPSTTRIYTQTFPTWSAPVRRSTTTRTTASSTVKYLYKAPSNALIYAGEED